MSGIQSSPPKSNPDFLVGLEDNQIVRIPIGNRLPVTYDPSTSQQYAGESPVSGAGRVSISTYGARTGRAVEDLVTTSGSAQVSSATASFTTADIGSVFTLCDPTDYTRVVNGTILSVESGTNCTLSTTVGYTATGVGMAFGPDNAAAIAAAIAALSVLGRQSTLFIPEGVFLTTQSFRVNDGYSIVGVGKAYGKATMPVGAGSAIILAANIATADAAFFQLGNFSGSASAGATGSIMEGVVIDAANNADRSVWTRCRRARMQHAGAWRGRKATLFVSAQNSVYENVTIAGHNTGNVVHIDGDNAADTKFFGGSEFRQGGAAAFNASLGHQMYIENPANVSVIGCHMYSGEFSQVFSTAQGANVMVRKTAASTTNGGEVNIQGCWMDGTYGPKMHVRNESANRLSGIHFSNNTCIALGGVAGVGGELDNRFGVVELAPVGAGAIRMVNVQGNTIAHNGAGRAYRGIVVYQNIDGTTAGLAANTQLTHIGVNNNKALGVIALTAGFTPASSSGNVWSAAGSVTENVG